MAKVEALKSGIQGFTNAINRMVEKHPGYEKLHGIEQNLIDGKIKNNFARTLSDDMFDASGKLSEDGQKNLKNIISEFGLSVKAKWDDILESKLKYDQNKAKRAISESVKKTVEKPKVPEGQIGVKWATPAVSEFDKAVLNVK